jgi:uncharacterized protein (TIGR03086 family)
MDIRELDRRALAYAGVVIAEVEADRLMLPTPCPDWTLHGLLRHLVGQNEGFAAAARGGGAALSVWRNGRLGEDPRADVERSARLVGEAFGEDGVLDRMFDLPEVGSAFPGPVAIGFHFVDTVVHAWDVARTIGAEWDPGDEMVAAAIRIAVRVPDTPGSRGPGLAFEPGVELPAEAPDRDRLLALLGRSPSWRGLD